MKRQFLLLAITAAALSSCTTAYRSGQTPDDVYFSPARPQDEYVQVKEKDEYRYDDGYYDDRYLRMKVQNRSRWDYLDDWYSYDRYGYRYNYYYGTYYNPYTSWNYYYNPYCRNNVVIYNPKQTSNSNAYASKPRNFNLSSYTNTSFNNANNNGVRMNSVKPGTVNRPIYNNTNSNNRSFSNTVKDFFNSNNNSSNNSNAPTRTYTPSSSGSSGSSSSGSSGSSSSGTTRPSRGGN